MIATESHAGDGFYVGLLILLTQLCAIGIVEYGAGKAHLLL